MGATKHPAQNPPPLDGLALVAQRFYSMYGQSAFVREFGLMQRQLDRLKLNAQAEGVFLAMLDAIHRHASGMDNHGEE